jgi:hypothetical protein
MSTDANETIPSILNKNPNLMEVSNILPTGAIIPYSVRIVFKGERYGLNEVLIHDRKEPLVEFYDARYAHTQYGQFVSRYYVSSVLGHPGNYGLSLYGGVPDWTLSAETMQAVKVWLRSVTGGGQEFGAAS